MKSKDNLIQDILSDPEIRVTENGCVQRFTNKKGWHTIGYKSRSNDRRVYLRTKYHQQMVYIHRIVYAALVGPLNKNQVIDHIDGNTFNNHPSNLRLVDISINLRNTKNPFRKRKRLTDEEKYKILELRESGETLVFIASKLNVSTMTVERVLKQLSIHSV